ncbi:ankyrin repeat-containing protein [Cavenderia fasciculata]|uniref:Ankyrin repeat-containing protein n=1 Tax=Cavenderia fasciculata TaxID=261658 RepID=F4Q073_CACFS|nr:ankyrin repeat-containing protein [Cavenderia fasciculata]EGG18753.1 ankyrin repeat-containing protein [Cavenderia fasciculata]|eukprot:XP_004357215.1 ankyrin repeat-containing protein [Cavenderia fasciculata]
MSIPALHDAIINNDYERVSLLIESGKHALDEGDFGGLQPLHFCARMGHINMAELLLSKGANINAENNYGSTPLHEAVRRGEVEMVQYLIKKNCDVAAVDIDSNTALHLAVMCEDGELIPMLLEAGAPLYLKNKDDETPIQVTEDQEIIDFLKEWIVDHPNHSSTTKPPPTTTIQDQEIIESLNDDGDEKMKD